MGMKKSLSIIMVSVLTISLIGCGSSEAEIRGNSAVENQNTPVQTDVTEEMDVEVVQNPELTESEQSTVQDSSSSLVVYFSWSGNTENVANAIAEQTGADVFEIVPKEAYIDDYNALLDIATEEKENGARPAITGSIEDITQYDIIYVGFPNWWSDMPMILYTFFDSYDLSGKTIAPFCTSGGSGLSGTVSSIRELEPEANVLDGLHIGSSAASDPDQAVSNWLENLGFME